MDLHLGISPDMSPEEEGEFESARESMEPGMGQDWGSENAWLMEHPQLGWLDNQQAETEGGEPQQVG